MKRNFTITGLWILIQLVCTSSLLAQDPLRFEKEVEEITAVKPANQKDIILFTGSSTIRMWKDIQSYFPGHNILNTGFGGSQTSDLVYYADKLILQYSPKQIFIYEGDNDLSAGKTTAEIIHASDSLVKLIRSKLGGKVYIVFITPKPSKARWHLKEKYEEYNKALVLWSKKQTRVAVADLWTPMLDKNGIVFQDIFLADGLHMNKQGYAIWGKAIAPLLK